MRGSFEFGFCLKVASTKNDVFSYYTMQMSRFLVEYNVTYDNEVVHGYRYCETLSFFILLLNYNYN